MPEPELTVGAGPAAEPEIRYLGDVQRLRLEPGDLLVLSVDGYLSDAELASLGERLQSKLEGRKCIVLGHGMRFSAISLNPDAVKTEVVVTFDLAANTDGSTVKQMAEATFAGAQKAFQRNT